MHIPKYLLEQFGQFEKEVINQADVKITDFVEPFGTSTNTNRITKKDNCYWIKSDSLGKAFKVDNSQRKIIEYLTD